MNTIASQKYGWAALTICVLTGAYIGRSMETSKDKRGDQHQTLMRQRVEFRAAREKWLANKAKQDEGGDNSPPV
tara:strand:- start:642 stop:863 length:222 start_codon:yes stop_codon:yes gene_type:complete